MIDRFPSTEIDKIISRILKEAGMKQPPFLIEDLLTHLELYRGFYDLTNPSLIQRAWHKSRVGGQKITNIAGKISLCAIWFPDKQQILIDESLPAPKKNWASFHDTSHTVLPWHKEFFLGDTAQTLDPDFQEMLESEAHYGASAFMFGGQIFTKETLDTPRQWDSVALLKKRENRLWCVPDVSVCGGGSCRAFPLPSERTPGGWFDKRVRRFEGMRKILLESLLIVEQS